MTAPIVHVITRPDPGAGTSRIVTALAERGARPQWTSDPRTVIGAHDVIIGRIRGDEIGCARLLDHYTTLVEDAPLGTRVINAPHAVRTATSKHHQLGVYRAMGIPAPRTIRLRPHTDLTAVVDALGLPLVVKTDTASDGRGVHLVGDIADLRTVADQSSDAILLAQSYVPSAAQTVSMIVLARQVVATGRSHAGEGRWKTNPNDGAHWSGYYPSFRQADLAVAVCSAIGLDLGEVEIADTDSGPVVLKIDPSPHLTVVEQVTGVDVAALIADYALETS